MTITAYNNGVEPMTEAERKLLMHIAGSAPFEETTYWLIDAVRTEQTFVNNQKAVANAAIRLDEHTHTRADTVGIQSKFVVDRLEVADDDPSHNGIFTVKLFVGDTVWLSPDDVKRLHEWLGARLRMQGNR